MRGMIVSRYGGGAAQRRRARPHCSTPVVLPRGCDVDEAEEEGHMAVLGNWGTLIPEDEVSAGVCGWVWTDETVSFYFSLFFFSKPARQGNGLQENRN